MHRQWMPHLFAVEPHCQLQSFGTASTIVTNIWQRLDSTIKCTLYRETTCTSLVPASTLKSTGMQNCNIRARSYIDRHAFIETWLHNTCRSRQRSRFFFNARHVTYIAFYMRAATKKLYIFMRQSAKRLKLEECWAICKTTFSSFGSKCMDFPLHYYQRGLPLGQITHNWVSDSKQRVMLISTYHSQSHVIE